MKKYLEWATKSKSPKQEEIRGQDSTAEIRGSIIRVVVGPRDMLTFVASFPASGLEEIDEIAFEFQTNGDLVDIEVREPRGVSSGDIDGQGLKALSEDANNFAADKLGLPDLFRR